MYPLKTEMKTDGQLYTGGEVQFPAELWQTPAAERYSELDTDGVEGYFIDSIQGTKVFAFVGIPENASAENKVPGIVLVHGGGGTAFSQWVKYWVQRGYAAIAMDTEGNMPTETSSMNNNDHIESIRPHGPLNTAFSDSSKPIEEQWAYHAIASVIVSNSFLRSFEGVDTSRIGISGISYGAFLTCQSAAYDDRYVFAAPVYGSLEQEGYDTEFGRLMHDRTAELWDSADILKGNRTPFFFLNSNTDTFFSVLATTENLQKLQYGGMLLLFNFPHGHETGAFEVPEILTFVDNICLEEAGLCMVERQPTAENTTMAVKLPEGVSIQEVTGYYTVSDTLNQTTAWLPIVGDYSGTECEVSIPGNAKYFYMNMKDSRGLEISSQVIALKK